MNYEQDNQNNESIITRRICGLDLELSTEVTSLSYRSFTSHQAARMDFILFYFLNQNTR